MKIIQVIFAILFLLYCYTYFNAPRYIDYPIEREEFKDIHVFNYHDI